MFRALRNCIRFVSFGHDVMRDGLTFLSRVNRRLGDLKMPICSHSRVQLKPLLLHQVQFLLLLPLKLLVSFLHPLPKTSL